MTLPLTSTSTHRGIELRGVVRSFGAVRAVRHVDLTVAPGETLALLGPNGAGKSTTIDMILGLLPPERGEVAVFGLPPADAVAAGVVGAMLQTGSLVRDLRVRELLAMMASLYPEPLGVDEVIDLTDLSDIAGRLTQRLSGGQTQRVRFALALICNPRLLVLDEPTVAMDVESRRSFWGSMRAFAARGRTVLFATHYLEEADAYADRVVLMAGGRIVADGAANEIKGRVGTRTIRATLAGAKRSALERLPGVVRVDERGDAVIVTTTRGDDALKQLLQMHPDARDIEVRGAGLEEAFLELTAGVDEGMRA